MKRFDPWRPSVSAAASANTNGFDIAEGEGTWVSSDS